MNIQVQVRHGEMAEATREKIAEKVAKLERFVERISDINVLVDLDKADEPKVEVTVVTELKKDFRAEYTSGDLWGCLDQTIDKLEQQMRKFKEKLTDHR
ncbi:MAG: ribosome-associated translation inhibitor RaiA [Thermoguttaceae bacterium]|nr:ribosome-associated translation inhibitor RaiA [Thermoguttaceae bacterium]MBQ9813045.1 ribosome-associated translation inhibitor RaiA [Thermoguttaceae bacterium]MBR4751051.1 ribosome-associated translation inhibitor RaiA [Thermoguttaceae bacterium]MBR5758484.1 ribosome-associated translation inhibitor RaiA [Thermoguttaceae bacterium]